MHHAELETIPGLKRVERLSKSNMRVTVFAPLYPPAFRGGGPIRSINALVSLCPPHVIPYVLTGDRDLGVDEPLPVPSNGWCRQDAADVYYATARSPRLYWRALRAVQRRKSDLLHFNSFMNPLFTIIPLLLWRLGFWGRPTLLLAPRGEFGEGALGRRALKKRAYITLFRMLKMPRHVIWHSTAPHETASIQELWGTEAVIVERGNDTLLPRTAAEPLMPPDGALRAVFLGRIVEHKGLAIALTALARVASPVDFEVYGSPEDAAYFAHCEALATALPRHVRVTFRGAVEPEGVLSVLAKQEVLLMPTAGENFGHVIAEAMSVSCVVVTTPDTPWTERLQAGGGIVVDRSVGSWVTVIEQLASETSDGRLAQRRAAGEAYNLWASRDQERHVWSLAVEAASGCSDPQG